MIFGDTALHDRDLASADLTFLGGSEDRAGVSVAGAGDMDGDGFADLLIGACGAEGVEMHSGAAFLVVGGPSLAEGSLYLADRRLLGEHHGDLAGWCVAAAGDMDADGVPDLLVGAPESDLGGQGSGVAYLVLGSALW